MHTSVRTDPIHAASRDGISHLVVVRDVALRAAEVRAFLEDPELEWLGSPLADAGAPAGMRRYLTDLGVQIGDGAHGLFRKAAFVDLGTLKQVGNAHELEVSWRAATLAPLFPVFAGQLAIADGELRLEGWYAPPGGVIGRIADRVLLQLAARGTARWLLAALADAVRSRAAESA